jgi:hypothetical protein
MYTICPRLLVEELIVVPTDVTAAGTTALFAGTLTLAFT